MLKIDRELENIYLIFQSVYCFLENSVRWEFENTVSILVELVLKKKQKNPYQSQLFKWELPFS